MRTGRGLRPGAPWGRGQGEGRRSWRRWRAAGTRGQAGQAARRSASGRDGGGMARNRAEGRGRRRGSRNDESTSGPARQQRRRQGPSGGRGAGGNDGGAGGRGPAGAAGEAEGRDGGGPRASGELIQWKREVATAVTAARTADECVLVQLVRIGARQARPAVVRCHRRDGQWVGTLLVRTAQEGMGVTRLDLQMREAVRWLQGATLRVGLLEGARSDDAVRAHAGAWRATLEELRRAARAGGGGAAAAAGSGQAAPAAGTGRTEGRGTAVARPGRLGSTAGEGGRLGDGTAGGGGRVHPAGRHGIPAAGGMGGAGGLGVLAGRHAGMHVGAAERMPQATRGGPAAARRKSGAADPRGGKRGASVGGKARGGAPWTRATERAGAAARRA